MLRKEQKEQKMTNERQEKGLDGHRPLQAKQGGGQDKVGIDPDGF